MSASFHPEDLFDRRLGHMLTKWKMDKRGEYIHLDDLWPGPAC